MSSLATQHDTPKEDVFLYTGGKIKLEREVYHHITHIIVASSVESLPEYAFNNWKALKSIEFQPKESALLANKSSETEAFSITSIEDGAFRDCRSLESIKIPPSVKSLGKYVFWKCRSLKKIHFSKHFTTNTTSPIEKIGEGCFDGCLDLVSIQLPENLTRIGYRMFTNCKNLTEILIPQNVVEIGDFAFFGCSSLSIVHLSKSLVRIGSQAFGYCKSIASIFVPPSMVDALRSAPEGSFSGVGSRCSRTNAFYYCSDNLLIMTENGFLFPSASNNQTDECPYSYATLNVDNIRDCIEQLPFGLRLESPLVQKDSVQDIFMKHYPDAAQASDNTHTTLLHHLVLLVASNISDYSCSNVMQIMSELLLKCPGLLKAEDQRGLTPLHTLATILHVHNKEQNYQCIDGNMHRDASLPSSSSVDAQEAFDMLIKTSGTQVIHDAIVQGVVSYSNALVEHQSLIWEAVKKIMNASMEILITPGEKGSKGDKGGLYPFMFAAVDANDNVSKASTQDEYCGCNHLTATYELLLARPDVLEMVKS